MSRPRRYELVGVPQHVVQRGNNRTTMFLRAADYRRYLDALCDAARQRHCDIHAYVLMTNHVHLLVTPQAPKALAQLMQSVGRRYVRYFNDSYGRSGTLWEGRYWASLVGSGDYLWNCHRYIELNPVRAGIAVDPADYPWSSHEPNALGRPDPILKEHPEYAALGTGLRARAAEYRQLFATAQDPAIVTEIRRRLKSCRAFGSESFEEQMGALLNRNIKRRKPGRPRTSPSGSEREIAV